MQVTVFFLDWYSIALLLVPVHLLRLVLVSIALMLVPVHLHRSAFFFLHWYQSHRSYIILVPVHLLNPFQSTTLLKCHKKIKLSSLF